jgi:ubiquitin-like-conjugating enzyme ATG10
MKTSLFSAELIDTTESLRLCSRKLSSFPHINDVEFDGACSALLESFELYGRRQSEWIGVDVVSHNETRYLKITKALSLHLNAPEASSESEGDELNEEDDEVAESSASCQTVIHYDIVLSPTYRVPVLYFAVSDTQYRCPPTMETLYSLVIPPHFKPQTESVGVIGGVTVTVSSS